MGILRGDRLLLHSMGRVVGRLGEMLVRSFDFEIVVEGHSRVLEGCAVSGQFGGNGRHAFWNFNHFAFRFWMGYKFFPAVGGLRLLRDLTLREASPKNGEVNLLASVSFWLRLHLESPSLLAVLIVSLGEQGEAAVGPGRLLLLVLDCLRRPICHEQ